MQMIETCQILRIIDQELAERFYSERLGFVVDWQHRFESHLPLYMATSRTVLSCISQAIPATRRRMVAFSCG
jgi:hypothetical protein